LPQLPVVVTMTSTFSRTNSATNSARCSTRPQPTDTQSQYCDPRSNPSSRRRCTRALTRGLSIKDELAPKKPIVRSFAACCARPAKGHETAEPPTRAINLRRFTERPQRTNLAGAEAITLRSPSAINSTFHEYTHTLIKLRRPHLDRKADDLGPIAIACPSLGHARILMNPVFSRTRAAVVGYISSASVGMFRAEKRRHILRLSRRTC